MWKPSLSSVAALIFIVCTLVSAANGICLTGTNFTAFPQNQLTSVGQIGVKIDCVTDPTAQKNCFWRWEYKSPNGWIVVSSNLTALSLGYYITPTGSLLIPTVKLSHGTQYRCTTPGNMVYGNPATLSIKARLSNIESDSMCVDEGTNGRFSFLATGYPTPNLSLYKLYKDERVPVIDGRFFVSQASVDIMSARLSDAGMYAVVANANEQVPLEELRFMISVRGREPPRVSLHPKSAYILEKESGSISVACSTNTSAAVKVQCSNLPDVEPDMIKWMKNGVEITEDSSRLVYTIANRTAGVSVLKISYVLSEHAGLYQCEAVNSQGKDTLSFKLQVYKACETSPCLNGGTCIPDKQKKATCLCQDHNLGHFCENIASDTIVVEKLQINVVFRWEFTTSEEGSLQLQLRTEQGDAPLSIDVQFQDRVIAFNRMYEKEWAGEERAYNLSLDTAALVLTILVEKDAFVIASNCSNTVFYYRYGHKGLSMEKVYAVASGGAIAFGKAPRKPSYQPGTVLYVQGVAPSSGNFSIQLFSLESGQIALNGLETIGLSMTFDVRNSVVVRNSFIAGSWGKEENEGKCLVQPSKSFAISVIWQLCAYEISVNGVHFASYNHRLPFPQDIMVMTSSLDHIDTIELM